MFVSLPTAGFFTMRNIALCTGLLWGLAGIVRAQQAPVYAPRLPGAPRYTVDDTVRAIRHLYARRREGARNWLYLNTVGILGVSHTLISTTTLVGNARIYRGVDQQQLTFFGVVFLALPTAVGVSKFVRFSTLREDQAVNDYLTTRQPSRGVGGHLRDKDFR